MAQVQYITLILTIFVLISHSFRFHGHHLVRLSSKSLLFHANSIQRVRLTPDEDRIPSSIEIAKFSGPGCILVRHSGDFDHFFMEQAVFIFNHDEAKGTQGVITSKPTAFTMGEVSPNIGVFEANTLYTGGNDGPDMATMLHRFELNGKAKYIGSGIYLGGIKEAQEFVKEGGASPKDFKFFFNVVEWAPGALRKEIDQGRWNLVRAPPEFIIGRSSSDLWDMATNLIASKAIADQTSSSSQII